MDYNVTWRKKDKGWQFIISYKDSIGKWKQKVNKVLKLKRRKTRYRQNVKRIKKNVKTVNKSYNKLTFSEFADIYVEHEKLYKSIKTIESLITVLHKFEDLNKKEMCKITTLDIQKIVDKVTKEGLNNNTTRYYLKRLNTLFKSAKEEYNIIDSMPTKNIKVGKPVPTKKKL